MYKFTALLRSHKDFIENVTSGHKKIAPANLNNTKKINQCHKSFLYCEATVSTYTLYTL